MIFRYLTNLGKSSSALAIAILLVLQVATALPPAFDSLASQSGAENTALSFTVHATDPESQTITYSMNSAPSGSALNPTTGQFSWTPGFSQSGTYIIEFGAADGTESSNQFITVTIANTNRAPVLVDVNPISADENTQITFSVFAADPDSDAVVYSATSVPSGAQFISATGLFIWTPSYSSSGAHSINFIASDGTLTDTLTVPITVNNVNIAPTINLLYPQTPVSTTFTNFNLTTDKDATCKYSSANVDYDSMNAFDKTGTLAHGELLTSISTATYYVKCKSTGGDIGSASFGITVSSAPKAEIILSPATPNRPGLMQVTLLSNTALQAAPALYYFFDETPAEKKLVSLESVSGSTTLFRGHMVIPSVKGIKTGTFEYRGTDLSGAVGSEITAGKTFIADDEAPEPPKTFRVLAIKEGIELSWTIDGEPAKEFRVYRNVGPGVTFSHLYKSANGTRFVDTEVSAGIQYAYKITAVDLAGNEGELSVEHMEIGPDTSAPVPTATAVITSKLSLDGQRKINASIRELDEAILDLGLVATTLEAQAQDPQRKVNERLGLAERPQSLKAELEGTKAELKNMDIYSASEEDVERMREKAALKLKKANLTAVKTITVLEDSRALQLLSPERIDSLAESTTKTMNLTPNQKSKYVDLFKEWNSKLKVNIRIISATLKFLDGHDEHVTIVIKDTTFESPEMANSAWVMERIPKEVAQSASEIQFTPAPTIVEDDPLLRWSLPEGDLQHLVVEYVLSKKVSPDTLKSTSTYLVQDPGFFFSQKSNQISSFSIFPRISTTGPGLLGWSLIIGVLSIGGLAGVYTYLVQKNTKKKEPKVADSIGPIESRPLRFYFEDGSCVSDIPGLLKKLETVDEETFKRHAIPEHNDFCIWMHEALDEKEIALELYEIPTKKEFCDKLLKLYTDKVMKKAG